MSHILMTSKPAFLPLTITAAPGTPLEGVISITVSGNQMYEYAVADVNHMPPLEEIKWTYALGSEEVTVRDPTYDGSLKLSLVYKSAYMDTPATVTFSGDVTGCNGPAPRWAMGTTRAPEGDRPAEGAGPAEAPKPAEGAGPAEAPKPADASRPGGGKPAPAQSSNSDCGISKNLPHILIAGGLIALGVHYATSEKGKASLRRAGRSIRRGISKAGRRISRLTSRSRLPGTRTNLPLIRTGALTN